VTKEKFDALVESLDRMGLGKSEDNSVHRLESTQNNGLLVLVIPSPLFESRIESSLVLWKKSKSSYNVYPIVSRMQATRETMRMPGLYLGSWVRFEPRHQQHGNELISTFFLSQTYPRFIRTKGLNFSLLIL